MDDISSVVGEYFMILTDRKIRRRFNPYSQSSGWLKAIITVSNETSHFKVVLVGDRFTGERFLIVVE